MSQRTDEQTAMLNEWVRPLIVEFLGTLRSSSRRRQVASTRPLR